MPEAAAWELVKSSISTSFQLFDGHLSEVDKADWFRMPTEGVTHVAWQAGHIAFSNYGIGLRMQRGERPADAELGLTNYKELFGQGSIPSSDASIYPSADVIHATIKKVFAQVAQEINEWPLADLDSPIEHPRFKTRFDVLKFLPAHNFMHFGQVSLLRRLYGNAPLR